MFATTFDKTVKIWDIRRFETDSEIVNSELPGGNIRQIHFDPTYGKMILTLEKDCLRLLKANDLTQLDTFIHKRKLASCSFLPFKNC